MAKNQSLSTQEAGAAPPDDNGAPAETQIPNGTPAAESEDVQVAPPAAEAPLEVAPDEAPEVQEAGAAPPDEAPEAKQDPAIAVASDLPDYQAESRWQFANTVLLGSPAYAVDREGWYSASVNQDGSAEITVMHLGRSLHNRQPGQTFVGDITFTVPNVEEFSDLLWDLAQRAQDLIAADTANMAKAREEQEAQLTAQVEEVPADGLKSPEQARLESIAAEYGLAAVPPDRMLDAVAQAVGYERQPDEGFDQYLDAVFARADEVKVNA